MRLWLVALIYTLAFLAGLATLWAVTVLAVLDLFEQRSDSLFVLLMIPLMAALAVFSVVYGLASGRALKWQYWLFAPLVMALLAWSVPKLILLGYATVFQGFVGAVMLVFFGGFLACLKRDGIAVSSEAGM